MYLYLQKIALFADIPAARRAELDLGACSFVDMTAEEVIGLMLDDEVFNRGAAGVHFSVHAV